MPKGVRTGNPTNLVCWLVGGHYNETVWGIAYDIDNLHDEIEMVHYENPVAKEKGVKILGITETSPGDKLVTEQYDLVFAQDSPPAHAVYIEQTSPQWDEFHNEPDGFIEDFKHKKGYDLAEEHLDPTHMPGTPRVVNLNDPPQT